MKYNLFEMGTTTKKPAIAVSSAGDRKDLADYIGALSLHINDLEIDVLNAIERKDSCVKKIFRLQKSIEQLQTAKISMREAEIASLIEFKAVKEALGADKFGLALELALGKELDGKLKILNKEIEEVKKEMNKMETRFSSLGKILFLNFKGFNE